MSKKGVANALGVDPGTMFFQVAYEDENKKVKIKSVRNAFVELDATEDTEEILRQNDWQYIEDEGKIYIIGEDSLRIAKMLPGKVELRRPMQDGVLNKGEEKKNLVMAELIEQSVGKAPDEKSVICTCVSSESADGSVDSRYHQARLSGMFTRLGWNVKIIEEGHAVVLSQNPIMIEEDGSTSSYSGIGLSFGAGRVNCVLARKGLHILGISCARAGDWVDRQVSEQTDVPISQVISAKEKKLNFENIDLEDDLLFALDVYYGAMIEYVFKIFGERFREVKSDFEVPLEIVVAGGTSMPRGFCKKLEQVIRGMKLPFEISKIRHADDPRNAVVEGCLLQAILYKKRLGASNEDKKLTDIIG